MLPVRITIMSYNLWNVVRWKEREPALGKFLTRFSPDILCTQEISDEAIDCISENLESHGHVMDELPGWHCESNIFWNREYFSEVGHGLEKMEMPEKERGLFWVRLKFTGSAKTILVATAHFTYQGNPQENESGYTPRNQEARQTVANLKRLGHENETIFFMGDLNDPVIPRVFFPQAGYESCFQTLGLLCPSTYPVVPTDISLSDHQTLDWIFCNGKAKIIAATSPQFYYQGVAPSDHWPLQAVYEI